MSKAVGNSFNIHTFGCKVNTYDTGLLQRRLAMAGFVSNPEKASIHVLNTCAVTAQATREAQRKIRRIKAENPFATVVVTGCAAQVDTDEFSTMSGVDLVIANSHKGDLENILRQHFLAKSPLKVYKSNIFKKIELESGGGREDAHTRSFLKVQDGCNSFCTYCVIPFARGKSRSISVPDLVHKVNQLYMDGVREVVVTGIHIGDYENDGAQLEDLMEAFLNKTKMPRFRISSLEPPEITDRLLELYQDPRMCPHFHMSIQSADSQILDLMKRNYSALDVEKVLDKIHEKVPCVFVGMDVIVGFPGETAKHYEQVYKRLEQLPWTRIHVFPYSERNGTYALKLGGKVPGPQISARAKELRKLSLDRYEQIARLQEGTIKSVLALRGGQFHSHDNWNFSLPENLVTGQIYQIKVGQLVEESLSKMTAQFHAERIEPQ